MDNKCCEKVSDNSQWGSFHPHQCSGKPFVERDGKTYCKRHDPERKKERALKADAKYHANDCKGCGHSFHGWYELQCFKFCPICGLKR